MKIGFKFDEDEICKYRLKTEEEFESQYGELWRDMVDQKWTPTLEDHLGEDLEDFCDLENVDLMNSKSAYGAFSTTIYDIDEAMDIFAVISGDMVLQSENFFDEEDIESDIEPSDELSSIARDLGSQARPVAVVPMNDIARELEAESAKARRALPSGPCMDKSLLEVTGELQSEAKISGKPASRVSILPSSDSPVCIAKDLAKEAVAKTIQSNRRALPDLGTYETNYKCEFSQEGLLRRK